MALEEAAATTSPFADLDANHDARERRQLAELAHGISPGELQAVHFALVAGACEQEGWASDVKTLFRMRRAMGEVRAEADAVGGAQAQSTVVARPFVGRDGRAVTLRSNFSRLRVNADNGVEVEQARMNAA